MTVTLKGGFEADDSRLGRLPQFDERSRAFAIRDILPGAAPLREKRWRLPERLDQGQEGSCVGHGWAHELCAQPVRVRQTHEDAVGIYERAQDLDEWPGKEPDYSGTSVLAGAKAVMETGHLIEYRWAFGIDDVLDALSAHGPVVIGVNWYTGMWDTDTDGYLHVTGRVAGGHCVCLRGIVREHGRWNVLGRNSWGRDWGDGGDFKLTADDLERLLSEDGDACVPVLRA